MHCHIGGRTPAPPFLEGSWPARSDSTFPAPSTTWLHAVSKGRVVFRDDRDRRVFLTILGTVVERFGWEVLAYCLMPNHFHLVVRTPAPTLSRGMRQLNGAYAQRFNRRYDRVGPLWQGRFFARLVQDDAYLLMVLRYVARNPVRSQLCATPREWRWSSHRATLGLAAPGVVALPQLLGLLGESPAEGQRRYRAATEDEGPDADLPDTLVMGDREFAAAVVGRAKPAAEVPRRQRFEGRPPLVDVLAAGGADAVRRAYVDYGYNQREIAEALGCHYSTVSRRLREADAA